MWIGDGMKAAGRIGRRGALAAAGAALAGCQQPGLRAGLPPLDPKRTGYIAFQVPIVPRSRDLFIADVNKLLDQGTGEIQVLLASPGGEVTAAQDMIAFMDRASAERGVRFITHNTGVVASAACYVFLAGQRRLSVPRGTFIFHEASLSLMANGPVNIGSRNLQEASAGIQQIERSFTAMLTSKTRLSAAEAASFTRRTVILNAEEARRDGVVDAVQNVVVPPDASGFIIRIAPPVPGPRTPQQPVPPEGLSKSARPS